MRGTYSQLSSPFIFKPSIYQQFIPKRTLTSITENPNSTITKPPSVPNDLETPGNFDTNRALNISGLLKSKKNTSLSFAPEENCVMDYQDTSKGSRKSLDGHQQQSSKAAFSVPHSPRLLFKERKPIIENSENNTTAYLSTSHSTQNRSSSTEGQNTPSLLSSSTTAFALSPSSFLRPDSNSVTKLDNNTSAFVTRPSTATTAFSFRTKDKDPTSKFNQLGPDFGNTLEPTSPQSLLQHYFMDSNMTNPPPTDPPEMPNNKHSASGTIERACVIDDDMERE